MPPDDPAGSDRGDAAESLEAQLYTRERYVLYCLARHGPMALSDLAGEVVTWESGERLPDLPQSEARTAYLSLVHTHVPRLKRLGLARYSPERDLLRLSEDARGLEPREPTRSEQAVRASSADG